MLTTLEVIKLTYDTIKIFLFFNEELGYYAISHYLKVITNFVKINSDIALEMKGKLKTITPKQAAIACSNVNIVKNLLKIFTAYDGESQIYNETRGYIEEIVNSARSKFLQALR
jgi:hypothetical protein